MTLLIYIDDYSDEVVPCQPKLEAWAEWLSTPDHSWGRDHAAKDGDRFAASGTEMQPDIIARRNGDGEWLLDGAVPDGADFFANRYGAGLGWEADSITGTAADMIDYLAEFADYESFEEVIAVGKNINDLMVTYHAPASGKPYCTYEAVQ